MFKTQVKLLRFTQFMASFPQPTFKVYELWSITRKCERFNFLFSTGNVPLYSERQRTRENCHLEKCFLCHIVHQLQLNCFVILQSCVTKQYHSFCFCILQSTDHSFVAKLTQNCSKSNIFIKSKHSNTTLFGICHYAGKVKDQMSPARPILLTCVYLEVG